MTLVAHHELDVDHLVADDRVHRLVYLDPAVFEAEMARIYARTWVYVGHESEVATPGDFKTTTIGRQPVVLVRQPDGTLAVLFNRCSHRASTVCLERRGSAHHFRCPYHGWTFRLDGSLIGATYGDGYDDGDLDGPEFALGRVPRVDSYRGFVFASLAAEGPSLRAHLGNAADYLDLFCDLSPTGRLVVGQPGEHHYGYEGNWKLQSENGVDGYHPNFVHGAYLDGVMPDGRGMRMFAPTSPGKAADLGNGHALLDTRPVLADGHEQQARATPAGRAHLEALSDRLGEARAREVVRTNGGLGFNLLVFPNLLLIQVQIRVVQPRRVDWTEVELYPTLLDGASEAMNARRLRVHESFYGPSGGGAPGDLAMFRRVQEGLQVESMEWLWLHRGRGRTTSGPGGERVGHISDEHPQRGFYRRWRAEMAR